MPAGAQPGIGNHLAGHRLEHAAGLGHVAQREQCAQTVEARRVVAGVERHRLAQLLQCAFGVALGQQGGGILHIFVGGRFIGAGHVLVEKGADLAFRQGPDEAVHRLAVFEHHAKRDAAHTEHLRQLARDVGLLVGVELGQLEATRVGDFQLFQQRAQRLARAAPRGPDVEQHRLLHRGVDQVGFKILQRNVDHGYGLVLCLMARLRQASR